MELKLRYARKLTSSEHIHQLWTFIIECLKLVTMS